MCRMFIASGNLDMNLLIESIANVAKDQNTIHELNKELGPGSWTHRDGWGIAYLNEAGEWVIKKSTQTIYEDDLIEEIKQIKTNLVVLHVRKKMGSEISLNNTHPFIIERDGQEPLIFCHNGFIDEEITFDSSFSLKGETDSEKLFYSILTYLHKDNIEKAIRKNFKRYQKITGTNIILSSKNKAVIAIRENHFPNYYRMKIGKTKDMVVISSEELKSLPHLNWQSLEQGEILSLDHNTLEISVSKQRKTIHQRISIFYNNLKESKYIPIEKLLRGLSNGN
ncbi:MAG: class II glutamine amidotransferase [Nanoarchaeota archaeon]|nr:class II glutamine amidotransferase [Nanoarchaeota archaeon]